MLVLGTGCVVVVSAGHEYVGGTHASGNVYSAADVCGMRGIGGVCEMCMYFARGGVKGEEGEWIRGLVLGFTNPVGTGVLDVCLDCGGLDQGLEGWGGVMSL